MEEKEEAKKKIGQRDKETKGEMFRLINRGGRNEEKRDAKARKR